MKKNKTMDILAVTAAILLATALLAVGVFAQSASLRFFGPISRILTPNGDARNDLGIFCFDNPADSDVTGKVYSLLGSEVAAMGPRTVSPNGCAVFGAVFSPGTSNQSLTWDGRSNGSVVRSGIYVYRITSELKSYTGTILVVR